MSAPLPIDSIQRPDPGQTLLDIQVRTCPGGVIVQLRGELDFTNTHRIEAVLRRLREQRLVYLDLAGLSFLRRRRRDPRGSRATTTPVGSHDPHPRRLPNPAGAGTDPRRSAPPDRQRHAVITRSIRDQPPPDAAITGPVG